MSNVVFPLNIAGAQPNLRRKPMFSTGVQTSASGMEARASWQSWPRYTYTLSIEVLRSDSVYQEFQRIMSGFSAALGMYDSFLLVDPNDSVAANTGFGVTDGASTAYQLQRTLGGLQQSGYWDSALYPVNTVPRANLLLQSQTVDASAWTKVNVTVTANSGVAPDGTKTADLLVESVSTNTVHYVEQGVTVPSAAAAYTFSAYALASSGRTWCVLQMIETTGATAATAWFNLATGAMGSVQTGTNWSNVSATITPSNMGWYRITVTGTKTNAAASVTCVYFAATSDANTVYVGSSGTAATLPWGFQFEKGSAVTQYLPTIAAAASDIPAYWPNFGDGFEPITEVNPGTLQIFVAGALKTVGVDFNYEGAGLVNFTSTPASGLPLTWSGNYFRRVRFANDDLELDRIFGQLWSGKAVEFLSIK